jgi:hypothetical protein
MLYRTLAETNPTEDRANYTMPYTLLVAVFTRPDKHNRSRHF